ncbi:MAG: cellulose synthase subunit BcsC-related outer membrane protein [Candidatus Rokuibacteriota bacterium]
MSLRAGVLAIVVFGVALLPGPGIAQTSREPSIYQPVTPEEIERLRRQIVEDERSTVEVVSDYHAESGDLNNRLDWWRAGARLNYKLKPGTVLYVSGTGTRYMTTDPHFAEWGANLTLGGGTALSDAVRVQLELGATYFTTDTVSVNGLAGVKFAPSDVWSLYAVASRSNVEESLLSATGLRPKVGPFAGDLVGPVMENKGVVGAIVKLPFKLDAFLEGGVGTRAGENVGSNFFQQVQGGLGYDVLSGLDDKPLSFVRVSYLLNYFGFADDRLGYGGASLLTADGQRINPNLLGSDGIAPSPGPGHPGVGGYFSPEYYVSNTVRAELAGRVIPELRYRFSAFVGVQSYTDQSTQAVGGLSATVEYALTDRVSIPATIRWDTLGPYSQETFSLKLVIKL